MKRVTTLMVGAAILFLSLASVFADDKKWKNDTELSYVHTGGNTEVATLSFKNLLSCQFTEKVISALKLEALYAESEGEVSAENYETELRTDYKLKAKFYIYGLAGYRTDEFAGLDNRYYGGLGAGYGFLEGPRHFLSGELGLNYSREEYTENLENKDENFTDGRAFALYEYAITDKSRFHQHVEYLQDFNENDNYRINSDTSLKVQINSVLSLKVGYEIHYDNTPTPETLDDTDTRFYTAFVASI